MLEHQNGAILKETCSGLLEVKSASFLRWGKGAGHPPLGEGAVPVVVPWKRVDERLQ
jgi:hypothetical protein